MAPKEEEPHGLATALILAAFAHALPPARVDAVGASPATADVSSNGVSQPDRPERLKQQVRITMDTNAAPAAATTNAVSPKAKSFDWKSSWEGWNGLHLELTRKTLLSRILPGVTNLEEPSFAKLAGLRPSGPLITVCTWKKTG